MNNIMLDLETMGTGSDVAIIAVGAVRFDKDVTDMFYEVVDLQSSIDAGLKIDASTVIWWMRQSDEARKQFEKEGITLALCLQKFSAWIREDAKVWGNGASFDNAILSNAYKLLSLKQPWDFWNDRCYRTVKNMNKNVKMDRSGIYHCAVDDAENQARHLIKILSC